MVNGKYIAKWTEDALTDLGQYHNHSLKPTAKPKIVGDRDLGSAAGAVIGGDLASDNNKAPVASGVIGALIGSAVGSEIGSKINEKNAIELTIELDTGRIISIAQEVSEQFSFFEGQRVKVVKSNYRSRVQPFNN